MATVPDLYLPPAADPPDPDFRETRAGGHALVLEYAAGHALVVEYGDCEFFFTCQCGRSLSPLPLRPDKPWRPVQDLWVEHAPAGNRVVLAHCQCGTPLGSSNFASDLTEHWTDAVSRNWERHTMTEVQS